MQNDKYKIDSHKLMYHPQRVADWLAQKDIYPIYVEVSPIGMCNHRCVFCSVDFMGYRKKSLPTELLKQRLTEMGNLGVKSIMYAGEGEPFLHKDMAELIVHTKQAGIDVALTTNGALMKPGIPEKILGSTEWIKVSCNAGSLETYSAIHQTKPDDFSRVIDNLRHAVKVRKEGGYQCTLGIQLLLLPENAHEVGTLATIARDIGLDYLVVKPYTHHASNDHNFSVQYEHFAHLEQELQQFTTETFSVIFRANTMKKWDTGHRSYEKCQALPFWSYIDSEGNVWGCSAHLKDHRFLYGNINDLSFQEIWQGDKRQQSLQWVQSGLDIASCKLNCRMDEPNRYLWELRNPIAHVNFI